MNKWKVAFWMTLLAVFALGATQFQKFILLPSTNSQMYMIAASTTTSTAVLAARTATQRTKYDIEADDNVTVCISTYPLTQSQISGATGVLYWAMVQNDHFGSDVQPYGGVLYAISSGATASVIKVREEWR